MAIPTPETAQLKILMDKKGRMQAFYRGEPLIGVTSIECDQSGREPRAEVKLTFIGCCVNFDTEPSD